jgi:hypothetical protein
MVHFGVEFACQLLPIIGGQRSPEMSPLLTMARPGCTIPIVPIMFAGWNIEAKKFAGRWKR